MTSPSSRKRTRPPGPCSYTAVANKYARDVIAGKVLACKWVKLACQRHINDLKRSKTSAFPFKYVEEKAKRACKFVELMPHTKGRWAARSLRLKMEPWQVFITCSIFGWIDKDTSRYRYTEAYVAVPRKNGKSPWAAAIGNYKFAADGEYGAEVYSGATTEKQAWEVFRPARLMAKNTSAFVKQFGIDVRAKSMVITANTSRFEPVIGKPGDGSAPSCAIIDEFHEHDSDDLYDTMKTGMVGRENPLLLAITTAGDNMAGPCYALQEDGQKVLEGTIENERLFVIVFTIDEGDDWKSDLALRKANPNYGISVDPEKIRAGQKDAIQSARKQNTFQRKHLNVWTNVNVVWMNMVTWGQCADPSLKLEDFAGQPCIEAFDLASQKDLAAKVWMFRRVEDPDNPAKDHYYMFARHYLNERAIEESKGSHYDGWANDGLLIKTPGNITDYKLIADEVVEDSSRFVVREVPYDEYHSAGIIPFVQSNENWNQTIPFVKVPQTTAMLSPAMKAFEALVLDGRLHHNGDPILTWEMSNVVCKPDAKDNIFPRKTREQNKIDGAVCAFMCTNRWLAQPRDLDSGSIYGSRGIRSI